MLRPYGGADWTVVDPASGVAFVDARWSFVLPAVVSSSCDDEKDQATSVDREVFVRSDGPFLPGPEQTKAHVRLSFETAGTIATQGVTWLNFVVGTLQPFLCPSCEAKTNQRAGLGVLEILNPSNTSLYDVKVDVFIRSFCRSFRQLPFPGANDRVLRQLRASTDRLPGFKPRKNAHYHSRVFLLPLFHLLRRRLFSLPSQPLCAIKLWRTFSSSQPEVQQGDLFLDFPFPPPMISKERKVAVETVLRQHDGYGSSALTDEEEAAEH